MMEGVYLYKRAITIDHTKIDATLTDFPVLVALTNINFDFSKARSDGYDIRFTAADGVTELKYERDRHDVGNELAEYFVKVPSISADEDTIIYMYYGKADATDGADPSNVWDSYFKGVYHKSDATTSTVGDSTINENTGTKKDADEPIEDDGKINKAQNYDGSDDYIGFNYALGTALNGAAGMTFSAWIKNDDLPASSQTRTIFCTRVKEASAGFLVELEYENLLAVGARSVSTDSFQNKTIAFLTTGQYKHIVGVADFPNDKILIYVDGELELEEAVTFGNTAYTRDASQDHDDMLGSADAANRYFNGIIDEARVSNTIRTAAWIKAEYNSGSGTLLSVGVEEGLERAYMLFDTTLQAQMRQYFPFDTSLAIGGARYFPFDANMINGGVRYMPFIITMVPRIPKPMTGAWYQRLSSVKKTVS
jgi:hypothetical protein